MDLVNRDKNAGMTSPPVWSEYQNIINQYSNNEELKTAILGSCFIPVVSGLLPPRYRGVRILGEEGIQKMFECDL